MSGRFVRSVSVDHGKYYEPVIWHQMGTKGHSVLKRRSHNMPGYHPVVVPHRNYFLSSADTYGIDDSINRAEYFSNAVLEDTYDAAAKSRGRDASLLRSANAAIVPELPQRRAKSSVASMRSMRASTAPPVSRPAPAVKPAPAVVKPKPTVKKPHRDVDGFTKPTNILSWEHKLDARVNPSDIIYQPESYSRLRQNLRNVQDKMFRQRQLLDRYLDPKNMSTSNTPRKDVTSKYNY